MLCKCWSVAMVRKPWQPPPTLPSQIPPAPPVYFLLRLMQSNLRIEGERKRGRGGEKEREGKTTRRRQRKEENLEGARL